MRDFSPAVVSGMYFERLSFGLVPMSILGVRIVPSFHANQHVSIGVCPDLPLDTRSQLPQAAWQEFTAMSALNVNVVKLAMGWGTVYLVITSAFLIIFVADRSLNACVCGCRIGCGCKVGRRARRAAEAGAVHQMDHKCCQNWYAPDPGDHHRLQHAHPDYSCLFIRVLGETNQNQIQYHSAHLDHTSA